MTRLIEPTSKTLEEDVDQLFASVFFEYPGQTFQIRRGRYIVNGHTYPYECLLLDDNDTVIDGYCGFPLPWLHWKGTIFVDHLLELHKLEKPRWYDEILDWDPETLDKQHWKL